MLDGTQAEPETSPTPGAPTGAGSRYGIQRAGWLGGRARLGICQRFAERCRRFSRGRGLCPEARGVPAAGEGAPTLPPAALGEERCGLLLLHTLRAATPGLCGFCRVPAPGRALAGACFLATGVSYQLQRLVCVVPEAPFLYSGGCSPEFKGTYLFVCLAFLFP